MKIILATTSPYRIEAMNFSGIDFESKGSDVEEKFDGRPDNPGELVKELSKLKAEAVAKDCVDALVIGFDSIGYYKRDILEKPQSYEEGFERLKKLSGSEHEFYTGITMINTKTNEIKQDVVITKVKFRGLGEEEINKYLKEDEKYKTYALGYDPLANRSSTFIEKIEGDHNNICRGIPTARIIEMIKGK